MSKRHREFSSPDGKKFARIPADYGWKKTVFIIVAMMS